MLLDIRETVRNSKPIKYTLITLICIPFVFVGVGSYLSGGSIPDVAEVDGVAISSQELDQAASQQRQRIQQMFGGNIPENFISEEQIREQALDQLVTGQVVRNAVSEQQFAIGDKTLGRAITTNGQFLVDGKFSPEAYQRFLQSSGTNATNFEESLRPDIALNQFQSGIYASSFSLPQETEAVEALAKQTRTIDFIRYSIDKAKEGIEVSDEDVSAFFTEHADEYKFPQRVKLAYLDLNKATLGAEVEVSDEEAQKYYDEFKARYVTAESRDASHILLTVTDPEDEAEVTAKTNDIELIKARVMAGESFADLAKEFSEDPGSAENGGSLGQITKGAMVPEFETAVYGLAAAGDLSDPVKTQYGIHLIKVDNIVAESGQSFDEVKEDVVKTIQKDAADNTFFELREALSDDTFNNPDSLEVAAENTGLEVIESDWVDSDSTDPLLSNPAILAAALSSEVLEDCINSELIEISNDQVVALRVIEHEDPRPKALEDVREELVETIKTERAAEQLNELVETALTQMAENKPLSEIVDGNELAAVTEDEVLTRQSTILDAQLVSEIYTLVKPEEGKPVIKSGTLSNGDRVAYELKAVAVPEVEVVAATEGEEANEAPEPKVQVANQRLGQVELGAMVAALKSRADVKLIKD